MPSEGDDVLMVTKEIALSGGPVSTGDKVVMHTEELARGLTLKEAGIDVIMLSEQVAQGNTAAIELGTLEGDTALYKGDTLLLEIDVLNNGTAETDYTVEFKEDGSAIDNQTKTLGPDGTSVFRTTVTKTNRGCFTYQANNSNDLNVCWMNVRPGDLQAFPRSVWLGASDTSSRLSIDVETPSDESNAQEIQIEFLENASVIGSETQTINPGTNHIFAESVSKTTEQTNDYTARITNLNTGVTVDSNTIQVKWTNDKEAAIDLAPLTADDKMPTVGETVNFSIDAVNTTTESINYTLGFFEGPTKFDEETRTVGSRESATYNTSRDRGLAGTRSYQARDSGGVNVSNRLEVTWMNVDPGPLSATETSLYLSDSDTTTTLSIDISNPTSAAVDVEVGIEEDGAVFDTFTRTISAGTTETFSTDRQKSTPGDFEYTATVTETDTGISGESNVVTVEWIEEETEFANIPIRAYVEDTGESGPTYASATIVPGGGDVTRLRKRATASRDNADIEYEDEEDFDFFDCDIVYDYPNWDTSGYCTIEIVHRETNNGHCWQVGDGAGTGSGGFYDVGCHSNDPENVQIFEGIFWQDGEVTDLSGSSFGTWK